MVSILTKFNNVRRKSLFQAFIMGLLSFTQPGIWTALAILGAGGLMTTKTANVANSALFAIMFALSAPFAVLTNVIGFKRGLFFGVLGFSIYSAGLYQNSKDGSQWLIMFGAVTCALSATIFWVVEAASTSLFPSEAERGMYIGIWQFVNKFGLIIAGSITLGLNIDANSSGSISLSTYAAFIGIQCAGILIVWFAVNPQDVIRGDGTSPKNNVANETVKERFWKLKDVILRKEVLLLAPLSISIMWFYTWQGNYMAVYFSVRARSLNTLLTAFVQMFADIVVGVLLDSKRWSNKKKLYWSWNILLALMTLFFVYGFIMEGIYKKTPVSGLDWTEDGFNRGFIPFVLFKAFGEALSNWIYWLVGIMNFHATEITYVIAVVRGLEAFGEMWAFVVGSVNASQMVNLSVSAGIFWVVAPSVTYLVYYVALPVGEKNLERNKILDAQLYAIEAALEKVDQVSDDDRGSSEGVAVVVDLEKGEKKD